MINQNDTNIFLRHKPEPDWCYRSGLTVYEERFLDGAFISGGLNGAGYPLDVLTNYRMYHHIQSIPEQRKQVVQIPKLGAANRSKSVLAVFKLPEGGAGPVTVIPRGVDSGRSYRVTFDNSGTQAVISGWELTGRRITTDPLSVMTSELILPEAIDN